jgi:hypothetical protein
MRCMLIVAFTGRTICIEVIEHGDRGLGGGAIECLDLEVLASEG